MGKQRFHYIITGYQWAPESYRVRKQLPGRPPKDVPLTPEERHEVGIPHNETNNEDFGECVTFSPAPTGLVLWRT